MEKENLYMIKITGKDYLVFVGKTGSLDGEKLK